MSREVGQVCNYFCRIIHHPNPFVPYPSCLFLHLRQLILDLLSAQAFYSTVFSWTFNRSASSDGRTYDPNEIAVFETRGEVRCPNGGIIRVSEADWTRSHGKGGVVLYIYVDDINQYEEVSTSGFPFNLNLRLPTGPNPATPHKSRKSSKQAARR